MINQAKKAGLPTAIVKTMPTGPAFGAYNRYDAASALRRSDRNIALAKAEGSLREKTRRGIANLKSQAIYGVDAKTVPKMNPDERSRRALQNTYGLSAPGVHKVPAAASVISGVAAGQAAGQLAGRALTTPLRRKGVKGAKIPGMALGAIGSTIGGAAGARFATRGREKAYSGAEQRLRARSGL